MRNIKFFLASVLMLLLLELSPAAARDFSLESYFVGKTRAVGSFSAITGLKRKFTVDLTGRWKDQTLTLVEDFVYEDGERERKTWRFTKISDGHYRGTREDVVGETLVKISGDTARFTYLIDLPSKGGTNRVRFHDKMTLESDGRLINTALVTKFGFPVALTRVEFERP